MLIGGGEAPIFKDTELNFQLLLKTKKIFVGRGAKIRGAPSEMGGGAPPIPIYSTAFP